MKNVRTVEREREREGERERGPPVPGPDILLFSIDFSWSRPPAAWLNVRREEDRQLLHIEIFPGHHIRPPASESSTTAIFEIQPSPINPTDLMSCNEKLAWNDQITIRPHSTLHLPPPQYMGLECLLLIFMAMSDRQTHVNQPTN